MPRRASQSSSSHSKQSAPVSQAPPPQHHAPAPPPAAAPPAQGGGGGLMANLGGSIVSGIGSGIGFSAANRVMDGIFGARKTEVVHTHNEAPPAPAVSNTQQQDACMTQLNGLNQCMMSKPSASECQFELDALKACRGDAGSHGGMTSPPHQELS